MIVSNPMSKFPKEGLSVLWNLQHGRCALTGTVSKDMAPSRGWASPMEFTAINGATFSDNIGGAKGVTFDGLNDYFTFAGSDSRFSSSTTDWLFTEMIWFNLATWGTDNPSTSPNYGTNFVQWGGSGSLANWNGDYGSYQGILVGRQSTGTWSFLTHDNDGEKFDKPSDGGGDVLNRWYCVCWTNPYPSPIEFFIQGEPATNTGTLRQTSGFNQTSGRIGYGSDGYYHGAIGMFARWQRALADHEVKQAFDATKGYFGIQR